MKTHVFSAFVGFALALFLAWSHAAAGEISVHVSPNGSDKNPGTLDKPLATLEAARDAVRALTKRKLTQPVQVRIDQGTYVLTSPLVLTREDSGTSECSITYMAQPGEKVILSGGRQITGWQETSLNGKPLWTAKVSEVAQGKWYFHELWVNGQRRIRARHPNEGFLSIAGLPDATKDTPWNKGQNRFRFHRGDIKTWTNLADVDVVGLHLWVAVRMGIAGVDEKENIVTLVRKSQRRLTDGDAPARYYLENALDFLNTPGEWYLDRLSGALYYWPKAGEKVSEAEVIAPTLPCLLRLQGGGQAGQEVENVRIRGLTFQHAEWWPERNDNMEDQAAVRVPALVQGENLRHCSLENCTLAHAGAYGIHLGRGCQYNHVTGCELFDLGAGGIKIGETLQREDPFQQTHHNEVTDNAIFDCGVIFHQAVGIWIGQSFANHVAHNHIHDLYYTGISCGWTWGYGKTLARDNVIEFNHVHDLGKAWLSDMGGIYTLGTQPGTIVRSNVFHDINAYRYGGWGIYFDEGSTHILAENNLVYRTSHGGFHQHYGKENFVRNNIFAFGRDAQIRCTRPESHRSFTFERNIVYWEEGKLLDGPWDKVNVDFQKNVYWRVGDGPIRFGSSTFKEWQAKGMDTTGFIADPLFAFPRKNDFALAAQSPASRMGFIPLDLAQVGPRPERDRKR